ncbi:hypothetical protein [Streptomyces olivaceoviridis]|uniref:hypothetical protein n=1 Tax=Streptomyces olivaceoviridis TaxID=1921 RepID=UPI0036F55BB1
MSPSREFPYEDGNVTVLGPEIFASKDGAVISWRGENYVPQKRLQLAHQARRAKEHQLDGIRRALCDIGVIEDDDPYGHADLEDVIRQALAGWSDVTVVPQKACPMQQINLCMGPIDAATTAVITDTLRKIRRQKLGGDV